MNLQGNTQNAIVNFSGAAALKGKDMVIKDKLNIDCSGASSTSLSVDGDSFVKLSGASAFHLYGKGTVRKRDLSGASSLKKN